MLKLLLGLVLIGALLLTYTLIEPYWIKITKIPFAHSDIPPVFDGAKIVFVSDIHHGPFFARWRVASMVAKMNQLHPDIVIFGGDYVHRDQKYIVPCFEELQHANATYGRFGVLGNHDHWENADLTWQQMQRAGITILDNQAIWIKKGQERIKIGGIGDLWEDTQDLTPTLNDTTEEDFVILVSHNPDYAELLHTQKIDVILSGHTHAGQVTLFGQWAPLVPSRYGQKYRTGFIQTPNVQVIVTNGIGTITPPVRFFARPEIIIMTLKYQM
jgi:predicted MPP superfamily phosphohydrolase